MIRYDLPRILYKLSIEGEEPFPFLLTERNSNVSPTLTSKVENHNPHCQNALGDLGFHIHCDSPQGYSALNE